MYLNIDPQAHFQGDSGSGATIVYNNERFVAGIVSFVGTSTCANGPPACGIAWISSGSPLLTWLEQKGLNVRA
jgi:hypothetical protein